MNKVEVEIFEIKKTLEHIKIKIDILSKISILSKSGNNPKKEQGG